MKQEKEVKMTLLTTLTTELTRICGSEIWWWRHDGFGLALIDNYFDPKKETEVLKTTQPALNLTEIGIGIFIVIINMYVITYM